MLQSMILRSATTNILFTLLSMRESLLLTPQTGLVVKRVRPLMIVIIIRVCPSMIIPVCHGKKQCVIMTIIFHTSNLLLILLIMLVRKP